MFILHVILFAVIFTYIIIEGLSVPVQCFFKICLKYSWISETEYDPSGDSNSSFYVGADILDLLCLHDFFFIFSCIINAKVW